MATQNPDLGRQLERSYARGREDVQASLCSSNRSNITNIISISNINQHGERDVREDADIIFSSNNNSSRSIYIDSSSNGRNINNESGSSGSSGSDDGSPSPIRHVIGVNPWGFGSNGQAVGTGNNDHGDASLVSESSTSEEGIEGGGEEENRTGGPVVEESSIGRERIEGGGEEENRTGGPIVESASADTSYEEGDTALGLSERSGEINMGVNFDIGRGMNIVIGKRTDGVSDELVATVGSTVAMLSSAQAAVKENIANMQRQGLMLLEAKVAITTLAGRLHASEAEKHKLVFANDELSIKLMVMEEEEAARTSNRDGSGRAESAEAATFSVITENVELVATVEEEKRKNRALCAEMALLKATLATRGDSEAPSTPEDGRKATPTSNSTEATSQATSAATETPRNAARRPLTAVDPKSEEKGGNGGTSPPSLARQVKRSPVAKPTVPSTAGSLRRTDAVSPPIVDTFRSVVSANRGRRNTTTSRKMDSSPLQNKVSASHDINNNNTSPKAESPVQQTAATTRSYGARTAAMAGLDAVLPPRRFSARIAAKENRDSISTGRGVATRGSKRVENKRPLSSLRVTRSTFRAAEQAATAADNRLIAEPRVKDRKRFMRF